MFLYILISATMALRNRDDEHYEKAGPDPTFDKKQVRIESKFELFEVYT